MKRPPEAVGDRRAERLIHGDGNQSRCFGHVLDVVEALPKLLETPECFGKVVNIGNPEEISIKDLAEKAIEMTNSQSKVQFIPYAEAYGEGFEDMQRRVPCIDKAKALIGFQPTRTLENIINDVADEFREELRSEIANA